MRRALVMVVVLAVSLGGCVDPEPTPTAPAASSPSPPPATAILAESAWIKALVRFARTGDAGALAEVPLAREVHLGLGGALVLTRSAADLRHPAAWGRWTVDAFVTDAGVIEGLTLDLWEP